MSERYGKGNAERIGRLWVLHLKGTAFERGLQHGTLMRYRVRDTIAFYLDLPTLMASRTAGPGSFKLKAFNRLKRHLVARFIKKRDSEALEEARGLAVGLGMRFEEVAEALVLVDVLQVFGALLERKRKAGPPALPGWGCTSAIRETPSGLLFARNLDFWGAGYWDENPAIIFHHPDRGKAFCSVVSAGVPTGGLTAMNEDGLAIAVHQHGSMDASAGGSFIIDIAHTIIRRAGNVDEALEIASSFKPTGGWTLVMAGGSPPKAVALEMSSATHKPRFMTGGMLAASNHFHDEKLSERELQANLSATISSYARQQRALQLLGGPRISPARMAALLGDHFDPLAGWERSAGFTISRITNLSSAIFSLPDRRFWVSESPAPTSKGGFVGFDLQEELGGRPSTAVRLEGGRPPAKRVTSAQDMYLDAYKEYIYSGDLNRVLEILGTCATLDKGESTFPLMEGIIRALLGNYRGALASVSRSLEMEKCHLKRPLETLWKARVLDLLDRRKESLPLYGELAWSTDIPAVVTRAAKRGLKKAYGEKQLSGVVLDLADGDTFE